MEIGIKGISYSATERKYLVRVKKDSKRIYIGRYSSLEEAKEALESHEVAMKSSSDTPILESLRATFTPKKPKTTKLSKVKSSEVIKVIQPKVVNKSKVQNIKKTDAARTSQNLAETTTQVDYHKVGEISLHRILTYLIKEADKRGTSVFDVIVQEVAKRSK
jgi:hypothetical protein